MTTTTEAAVIPEWPETPPRVLFPRRFYHLVGWYIYEGTVPVECVEAPRSFIA